MIKYLISYTQPQNHFIDIEFETDEISSDQTAIQLPTWRPGRYELVYFAKNIQKWSAFDENDKPLIFKKTAHSTWLVNTSDVKALKVRYNYYANELNAGSTYLDEKQLFVNGVNCLVYIPKLINNKCELLLSLPENYEIACSLEIENKNHLIANNFHMLVDSPFIASGNMKHDEFKVKETVFHLWFQGEIQPNWNVLKKDIIKYTQLQLEVMQHFPRKEYHYLFQIFPNKFYHGVEHTGSTVLALGPGYELVPNGKMYNDLLGVCSHELFHVWNIKMLRPIEMFPYDYTRENYSNLGYVAEGVTTYYGDMFLFRSNVFPENQYLKLFSNLLNRHFDNYGRHNYSVAQSSFDTWLDGYVPGIPDRKVSIYNEGALCAFMTDILILKSTGGQQSLDDVMRYLYNNFALKGIGYSEEAYQTTIEKIAGISFDSFFQNYIWGTKDFKNMLQECLDYIGYDLAEADSDVYTEKNYGIRTIENEGCIIKAIFSGSVAEKCELALDDKIIAVNGNILDKNLNEWCKHFGDEIAITIERQKTLRNFKLKVEANKNYFKNFAITKQTNLTQEKEKLYKLWSGRRDKVIIAANEY